MNSNKLYRVHDRIAECDLGPIMLEKRDGPAMRTFAAVLADRNNALGQNPADYELRYLGEVDDETSIITPARNGPITVMTGASWLEIQSASREVSNQPPTDINSIRARAMEQLKQRDAEPLTLDSRHNTGIPIQTPRSPTNG